jgi:hypothetical protein
MWYGIACSRSSNNVAKDAIVFWNVGGCYGCMLRLNVDVGHWRQLDECN